MYIVAMDVRVINNGEATGFRRLRALSSIILHLELVFLCPMNLIRGVVEARILLASAGFGVSGNVSGSISVTTRCTVHTLQSCSTLQVHPLV